MIHHLTYRDAGGVNTYINYLVSCTNKQTKFEITRNKENTSLNRLYKQQSINSTIIFHDPNILRHYKFRGYTKIVLTLHGDNAYYYNAVEEFGEMVDGILCVSEAIQKHLRHRFRQKSFLVSPSIPFIKTSFCPRQLKSIIFIGRESTSKGVHLLPELDALLLTLRIRPIWNIVLGSRPENQISFRNWLKSEPERITTYESIPNDDVKKLIANSECLVLPSSTEGHPMVVIEALASGTAPFTSQYCSGCQSHFPNDPSGIVSPSNDVREMASKVGTYLQMTSEEKLSWRRSARQFASRNHDPQVNSQKLEEICNSMAATKKNRATAIRLKWTRRILRAVGLW